MYQIVAKEEKEENDDEDEEEEEGKLGKRREEARIGDCSILGKKIVGGGNIKRKYIDA